MSLHDPVYTCCSDYWFLHLQVNDVCRECKKPNTSGRPLSLHSRWQHQQGTLCEWTTREDGIVRSFTRWQISGSHPSHTQRSGVTGPYLKPPCGHSIHRHCLLVTQGWSNKTDMHWWRSSRSGEIVSDWWVRVDRLWEQAPERCVVFITCTHYRGIRQAKVNISLVNISHRLTWKT